MAATQADGEAGPDVARSPGGDLELLSNQGATGRGGGGKWKHQGTATARTWLSRSQLFAAEGTAVGGHQDPIHRFTESCLKCGRRQILVQNPKKQTTFNSGLNIHFPGRENLTKTPISASPKLLVCLDCGFTEFHIGKTELLRLSEDES